MNNSFLNIGASGLRVIDINLWVTGSSIVNASTPGYSRQEAVQMEDIPLYAGVGYFGQGANITAVKRICDQLLTAQAQSGQASTSATDQLDSLMSGLNKYMPDGNNGLISSLTSFLNATDGLASKPSDTTACQVFLSVAVGLRDCFSSITDQLSSLNNQVNTQVQTQTSTVNGTVQQIAVLNNQISKAEVSIGQPTSDLRDRCDQFVQTLNQSIKASVVQTGDGQFNTYVGNDQVLVQDNQSYQLMAVPSQYDPTQLSVGCKNPDGTVDIDDNQLGGGTPGGLMDFRSNTLIPVQNSLGRLAMAVSTDVNVRNKLGMDANGKMDTDPFSVVNLGVAPGTNNIGSGSLVASITDANVGQDYDYQVEYQGGAYTVSHYPDGSASVTMSSWSTTIDGVTLNLPGTVSSGDSLSVHPTANAVATMQTPTTDYHDVVAASPMVLNRGSNNTGSVAVSLLGVDNTHIGLSLTSSINLTHNSAVSGSPPGFPGSVTVTMGGTSTMYVGGTAPYTQGVTYALNGIQMMLSGSPGNGDTFTTSTNIASSTDNHNVSVLAKLRNNNLLDSGTTSIGSIWNNPVTQVGVQANHASTNLTSQKALLASSTQQQQSVSGVSLDKEAMNLMKYQQAYQISAKVMQTANSLFGSLLSTAGGQWVVLKKTPRLSITP